jgi:AcrR family transcriptional regulator
MVNNGDQVTPHAGHSRVLDAAVACIAESGLDGTSIRQVAARASLSIGAVQHHFPTKDALLSAAMAHVEWTYRQRLARAAAGAADEGELLSRVVHALVPDGVDDRRATAPWLAFVAHAAVHPPDRRGAPPAVAARRGRHHPVGRRGSS